MHTDDIEKLKYCEEKLPVEKIKYDEIPLWPFLKNDIIFSYLNSDAEASLSTTEHISRIKKLMKTVKRTSLSLLYKPNDVIVFTTDMQYRKKDEKYFNQLMGEIDTIFPNALHIVQHLKMQNDPCYYSGIDNLFIDYLSIIYSKIIRFDITRVEGRESFNEIDSVFNIKFPWVSRIKFYLAAVTIYEHIFRKIKPKMLFIECYYDSKTAASFAAKKLGILTIEMQHGSLNKKHFAYSSFKQITPNPIPDYLFCFGKKYKENISEYIYAPDHILNVGYYYLDYIKENSSVYKKKFKAKYGDLSTGKHIVTVASQVDIDKRILEYCEEIAQRDENIFIIFVPRIYKDYHSKVSINNLVIEKKLDIYTLMLCSDVTLGVGSTCVLESMVLGTPSVLIDMDGYATSYFGEMISGLNSIAISKNIEETIEYIYKAVSINKETVEKDGNCFYVDDHKGKIRKAISYVSR